MTRACSIQQDQGGSTLGVRLGAAAVLAVCIAALGAGVWLEPDPAGLGTHTQMGMSGCSWLAKYGRPCPTCGMTTAFSLAAHGQLISAAITQPAGALAALIIAMIAWAALWVLVTGCVAARYAGRLFRPATGAAALLIVLAAWVYKLAIT